MEGYLMAWRRSTEFSGRSRRMEYWMFSLIHAVVFLAFYLGGLLLSAAHMPEVGIPVLILCFIYSLAAIVPCLACSIRRLHDIGKSGWWLLLSLVPVVNLLLIVFACFDSEPGNNRYGPNPKSPAPYPVIG